jgi:hypothetical protein
MCKTVINAGKSMFIIIIIIGSGQRATPMVCLVDDLAPSSTGTGAITYA